MAVSLGGSVDDHGAEGQVDSWRFDLLGLRDAVEPVRLSSALHDEQTAAFQ